MRRPEEAANRMTQKLIADLDSIALAVEGVRQLADGTWDDRERILAMEGMLVVIRDHVRALMRGLDDQGRPQSATGRGAAGDRSTRRRRP